MDEAIPLQGEIRGRGTSTSRKRVRLTLGLIVVIVLAFGILAAYWFQKQPRERSSLAVASTISPEIREIDSTVTTSGTVRLRTGAEVRVGSQVSGIVRKLNVTVRKSKKSLCCRTRSISM